MYFNWDNKVESDNFKDFQKHDCPLSNKTGAIGGEQQLILSLTSIGTIVKGKCGCGYEKDITDYNLF